MDISSSSMSVAFGFLLLVSFVARRITASLDICSLGQWDLDGLSFSPAVVGLESKLDWRAWYFTLQSLCISKFSSINILCYFFSCVSQKHSVTLSILPYKLRLKQKRETKITSHVIYICFLHRYVASWDWLVAFTYHLGHTTVMNSVHLVYAAIEKVMRHFLPRPTQGTVVSILEVSI